MEEVAKRTLPVADRWTIRPPYRGQPRTGERGRNLAGDEILNVYEDTDWLAFRAEILPRLRGLGVRQVARRTGHSVAAASAVLRGDVRPREDAWAR